MHKHIITAEEDLAFVMRAIAECKAVAERAATEKAAQAKGLLSSVAVKWMQKYLILCLIHLLVDYDDSIPQSSQHYRGSYGN